MGLVSQSKGMLLILMTITWVGTPKLFAEDIIPRQFESLEAAMAYADRSFAGGSLQVFELNSQQYMVLTLHGSGVKDLAIAAYKKTDGKWVFAAEGERNPEGGSHTIVQKDDSIIISGEDGYESILIEAP